MHIKTSLVILLFAIAFASAGQNKKGYTIKGKIQLADSQKVYLSQFIVNGIRDSAVVKNGVFSFTGSVTEPTPFILSLERNYVNKPLFNFFGENGNIVLD